ncbi:Maf family protein, partial [Listeria monocytogenes]
MTTLILASSSPRRQQLLQQVGYEVHIDPSQTDERLSAGLSPAENALQLAQRKTEEVYERHQDAVVLGADTIVSQGNDVLGKPRDKSEAVDMLTRLSDSSHDVYTGVYIKGRSHTS